MCRPKSNNWPLLLCDPSLSCSVGPKGKHLPQSTDLLLCQSTTHPCAASSPLVPCARAPSAHRALGHMLNASIAPMLWWYAASRRGHHMLECHGNSSSEEASSSAADPGVEAARANSRDMASSRLEHSDADGKVELGLVNRKLVRTSRSTAATKGAGQKTREMGPWSRPGTQDFPRKTLSSRAVRLEPGRKPNNTSRRASRHPGGGVPGHLSSSDLGTTRPPYEPHTTQITDTTLPPCRRSTILWPAEPSSGSRGAASHTPAPATPGHLPLVARSGC